MTTKAIVYARFSPRPDADESQSNAKQIERCREYAAAHGYEVGHVYQDEALTGADDELNADPLVALAKRPGIIAAMDATKKGMVLLVRWRSRIARDLYVQQAVERIIMGHGGRVEATDESNETGLAGELTRGVLATISKWEVIKIRLLTKLAMTKYQNKEGRRMGRLDRCPWGFKPDLDSANNKRGRPSRLVVDPDETETARIILACHARGGGPTSICRYLDKIGRTRRGKTWTSNSGRGLVQSIIDRAGAKKPRAEKQQPPAQDHPSPDPDGTTPPPTQS